jgi:hypothetical protein
MNITDRPALGGDDEVTPAMIAAGVAALCSHNYDFESREDAVRRIYCDMVSAANASRLGVQREHS